MGDEDARLRQLRDRFAIARKKLEAIPETGLSDNGQPYTAAVAEALSAFAAWFGELTLDDMSLTGPAYRGLDVLNGVDAIVDWVGMHRSQQFAQDISEHMAELATKIAALDETISAVFTVNRTASTLVLSRKRRIPQSKRDAIEGSIQEVASLAGGLGVRLQRIALMVGSRIAPAGSRSSSRRAGRPQSDETLARDLLAGWDAFKPEEGRLQKGDYIARRPEVMAMKSLDARQKKAALLLTALNSALALRRSKARQMRPPRG